MEDAGLRIEDDIRRRHFKGRAARSLEGARPSVELLVELRQAGVNLPVVFLTGYGFTAQEELAFETGAIDFIDKARGVEILARRLGRLVRAPKSAAAPPSASLVVLRQARP